MSKESLAIYSLSTYTKQIRKRKPDGPKVSAVCSMAVVELNRASALEYLDRIGILSCALTLDSTQIINV